MRQTFPGCCARAASGHAVTAPPRSVMKSRRMDGWETCKLHSVDPQTYFSDVLTKLLHSMLWGLLAHFAAGGQPCPNGRSS